MTAERRKPFVDRQEIARIVGQTTIKEYYEFSEWTGKESAREIEIDALMLERAQAALDQSASYLVDLIWERDFTLRDLAMITDVPASTLCKIVAKAKTGSSGGRTIPWTSSEALLNDVFGVSCADFYMGEDGGTIILPKKFAPILEALRTAEKDEQKIYRDIIKEELEAANANDTIFTGQHETVRKAENLASRIADLAGDRYASMTEPYGGTRRIRKMLENIFQYAENATKKKDAPVKAPLVRSLITVSLIMDVPLDYLISSKCFKYLDAVYCDSRQKYQKVAVRDTNWLAKALLLSRNACGSFCANVIVRILNCKTN